MTHKRSRYGRYLKRRRFDFADSILGGKLTKTDAPTRVLEIGVDYGVDFMSMAVENPMLELYGMDLGPRRSKLNYEHIQGDAEKLDFPDGFFDVIVSFGVLEHIQPIEKLCSAISEINRASKSFCNMVPAVSTIFESHMASLFWQLRDRNKKPPHSQGSLNYFSDEAWLQFQGFLDARTERFSYLPFSFVKQLLIYRNDSDEMPVKA
jgi:ubiquinone/menaquinone biosynthesis C-methylase UbiE